MRRIDKASAPSASAMRMAAAAIWSRVKRGWRPVDSERVHTSSISRCDERRSRCSAARAAFFESFSCWRAVLEALASSLLA